MLLTGIITVLILGLRFESKKAINKEAYYQNVLIARSVYYRIKKDERFLEFMKDPRNNKDKSISIEDLGLECYNEKIPVKLQKTTRGYVLTYKIDYKGTTTFSSINFKETSSPLFNEFSVVKTDEEDIEMLLDNSLEKIEGDLVFYQDEKDLYYLKQEEYQRLIEEFTRVDSEINEEKRDDEGLEIDQEPKIIDENPEEIDIRDYLNHFNKIEGEYFYILENFKVLSKENPKLKGNIRDYASLNELLVLANMESYNAILISNGVGQKDRMIELRNLARKQLLSLANINKNIKSEENY